MLKIYKILLVCFYMFSLKSTVTAQQQKIIPQSIQDHVCKYQNKEGPVLSKSAINPNPLVFDYDIKFFKLDLEAYDTTSQFSGYAEITALVTAAQLDTFSVELSHKLSADSVSINGSLNAFDHSGNNIFVPVEPPLNSGDYITFRLYYHTPPDYSSIYYSVGESPYYGNFKSAQTIAEPYFGYEFMPCKQALEDKIDSVFIFVTTDNNLKVAGPGLLTTVPLPDNKVRYEWRSHETTAFYLVFFSVSDYQEYTIYAKPDSLPGDSIPVVNYVYDYPNCLESNKSTIDQTSSMIELLSDIYGLFPFYQEKYGHYMWYITNFSGMEHITMTGLRTFGFDLVSHELGHSWFGDDVTCATWSDVWVNEGFATYTQYIVRVNLISKASADAQMVAYQNYVMQQPTGSVYVPPSSLTSWGRIFSTRLTYRKGGALLHMIRFEMQDDSLFFRAMYEFHKQFAGGVATGEDFKNICEQVSGIEFTDFFNQWYYGEGFPVYSLDWSQEDDSLTLHIIQETSTPITPLYKMLMEYKITWQGGDTTIKVYHITNDTIIKYAINHEVENVMIDPNNWVLNGEGTIRHLKNVRLKVMMEGAFNQANNMMATDLNPDLIPVHQPYHQTPWNYNGAESLASTPPQNAVDWVLVELCDTTSAGLAKDASVFKRIAGLVMNDGTITAPDGTSPLQFDDTIQNNLFIRLWHRNHLAIISAFALDYQNGVYNFDFTTASGQVFGGLAGCKQLASGIFGMFAGDINADGTIGENDKTINWETEAGINGYLQADLNLDGEVDNQDKDEVWLGNLGASSQVPQ